MPSDFFLTVGAFAGAFASVLAVARLLTTVAQRTVVRRQVSAAKLARLIPGVRLKYFEAILGEPAFAATREGGFTTYTFVDPDFFVKSRVRDDDGTVVFYSVTTRDPKFHPRGPGMLSTVRLGKTRFGDVPFGDRDHPEAESVAGHYGAHSFGYSEMRFSGYTGGLNQRFGLGYCPVGVGGFDVRLDPAVHELFHHKGPLGVASENVLRRGDELYASGFDLLERVRRHLLINTFAVGAPKFEMEADPIGLGPSASQVGLLLWVNPAFKRKEFVRRLATRLEELSWELRSRVRRARAR
jgi:hypothetical protein